ncbi:antibiotic biosynthesis monooxygenase [Microbacterium sp. 2MCAF23]|uniref:antibiotic biosynthesis monooxygenase n=1 Tax=Microbacterium sp. 2MCAF23 TaxID=3232985 RepID=UPI003F965129
MYAHVAIHEPRTDRLDDTERILREISAGVIAPADGLIDLYMGRSLDGSRIFAITMWRDEEAARRTLPAIIDAVTATPVHGWAAVPPRVVRLDELV